MSLASALIRRAFAPSAHRFDRATRYPTEAQADLLLRIVRRNRDTEYGRRHGFGSIRTVRDYQRRVPVMEYEHVRADMQRVLAGERGIFTAENPVRFARTSGTAGEPKFIPVTPTCLERAHKDTFRTWAYHVLRDHPAVLDGQVVSLASPAVEGRTPAGIPFGSTTGQIHASLPRIVRRACAVPARAFEIQDYQGKYYAVMRISIEREATFLCTANPSSILKLCEKANEFSDRIIRDIRTGSLCGSIDIEPEIRRTLARRLRPNPTRAAHLARARSRRAGVLKPGDYWPNLQLIACWRGATVGHYVERFGYWFDPEGSRPVPVRDWGYLSSEARASVPLSDEGARGVLTVGANFFEFVEAGQRENRRDDPAAWDFRTVGELVDGAEYYVFLTTTGGLYRYDINDVVGVQGTYHRTPQIRFLRKGGGVTSITGEKVSVSQVIDACEHASQQTGAIPAHFRSLADVSAGRYVFRIEFTTAVPRETQEVFLRGIDRRLKEVNLEYKSKRDSLRLRPPVLQVMREGWHERDARRRVNTGERAFQAKNRLLVVAEEDAAQAGPDLLHVVEIHE